MGDKRETHYQGCDAWRSPCSPCMCLSIEAQLKDDRNPPVQKEPATCK